MIFIENIIRKLLKMKISYTCPLIDKVIAELQSYQVKGLQYAEYTFHDLDMLSILEKLEQLRQMNKDLRSEAEKYKSLYNALIFQEFEFNPETLPKCTP